MLEKIKQEIVVIIISISSMLITAFATIYGVQITNEHNLKMQDRQVKIENARKEIEKLDNIQSKLANIYYLYRKQIDNKESKNEVIEKIFSFTYEIINVDKDIYNKFIEFVKIITYEQEDETKATKSYIELIDIVKLKKEKIEKSISNSL